MKRDAILATLAAAAGDLQARYGVTGARLFGSVARGDDDPTSDVDIAVTFRDGRPDRAMTLCGVAGYLAGLLGSDVDVVARPARDARLEAAIATEGIHAF